MSMYVCIKFPKGEFYYVIKNEYTYANMMEYVCIIYISTPIIYMCIYIYLYNIGPRHFDVKEFTCIDMCIHIYISELIYI